MDADKGRAAVPLQELENSTEFLARHIGPSPQEIDEMLSELGHASLEDLVRAIVPDSIRCASPLRLGAPVSEAQALRKIAALGASNQVLRSLIGMGYYGTIMPGVIARNVFENPAWYTAYTP